ncbi:unnamed protein product [Brassica rapa]|uniref:Secreted protein n=1 Tax=Brassica campestris TaxID=3711 RepID=A0A3P6BML7_BRACM|nr:unnamed protein product [Brassica rapa]VDC97501.1 unnamed protein product [Brassica rapa]
MRTSSVPLLLLLLVTSWECFMFCFWLTSTTCEHHFLCIFQLPSVLSVGRPQRHMSKLQNPIYNCSTLLPGLMMLWNGTCTCYCCHKCFLLRLYSLNQSGPSIKFSGVCFHQATFSHMYLTFCGSRN